jgi:hypothetical protein
MTISSESTQLIAKDIRIEYIKILQIINFDIFGLVV